MTNFEADRCVCCGAMEGVVFYEVTGVPVDTGNLFASAEEAKAATCGKLVLEYCQVCHMVYNRAFDPSLIRFEPGYDASLCHSPNLSTQLAVTADALVEQFDLEGKAILEIGCGSAHLLRAICERATVRAVGIDPSVLNVKYCIGDSRITLLASKFSAQHSDAVGDVIFCISVIEDMQNPRQFLQWIRESIGSRECQLYFELFDGWTALCNRSVWSPHYEQCNYFGTESIKRLFEHAGFLVERIGTIKGREQYLQLVARPSDDVVVQSSGPKHVECFVAEFSHWVQMEIQSWSARLQEWSRQGKKVVLWGGGGKAITFLSLVPEASSILAVVDVNPNRQGKYLPSSAKQVISPTQLCKIAPDIVVLSNPSYQLEVVTQLKQLGLHCPVVPA